MSSWRDAGIFTIHHKIYFLYKMYEANTIPNPELCVGIKTEFFGYFVSLLLLYILLLLRAITVC